MSCGDLTNRRGHQNRTIVAPVTGFWMTSIFYSSTGSSRTIWRFVFLCRMLCSHGYRVSSVDRVDTELIFWIKSIVNEVNARIILYMRPANERRCYIVTSSLIGWAHTQNDPCKRYPFCRGREGAMLRKNRHIVGAFCCAQLWWIDKYQPISVRVTSIALWQSHNCPSISEAILKNMGKLLAHSKNKLYKTTQNKIKQYQFYNSWDIL